MTGRTGHAQRPEREDYARALASMGTFVDVNLDDLMTLARRAEQLAGRRQRGALEVAGIMTQPVMSVSPDTALAAAAHLMVGERISGLPVVDAGERLVGIITEADFLRALGVPSHQPAQTLWQTLETLFEHIGRQAEFEAPDDPVAAHMSRHVVTVSPASEVHELVASMQRHRVKRVVVCSGQGQVVGMVTRSDLVRVFFDTYQRAGRSA